MTTLQVEESQVPQRDESRPASVGRKPDFFIVGAPKCGTTTLYAYLSGHPEVFMPAVKEPNYFLEGPAQLGLDEPSYLALFRDAGSADRAGEATPMYLYCESSPAKIKAFNPDAQIIIMLRNPVDFMFSLHNHQLQAMHGEDLPRFEEALAAEPERRQGRALPPDLRTPALLSLLPGHGPVQRPGPTLLRHLRPRSRPHHPVPRVHRRPER